ncbi:hypothetical protein [Cupriavidus basilensis]|uniref:hypothetical protein n=1 Tax=Cupriavidus basilensis TaxID=68895 RepID=UPI00157B0CD1|nr:hypothetical protein [Cupriavidus basilensis]NUA26311.1 hypothetical protein [Cupriavidus basilensis]
MMDRHAESIAACSAAALKLLNGITKLDIEPEDGSNEALAMSLCDQFRILARNARELETERAAEQALELEGSVEEPDMVTAILTGLIEAIRQLLNVALRTLGLREIPLLFGPEVDVDGTSEPSVETQLAAISNEPAVPSHRELGELIERLLSPEISPEERADAEQAMTEEIGGRLAAFRGQFPNAAASAIRFSPSVKHP